MPDFQEVRNPLIISKIDFQNWNQICLNSASTLTAKHWWNRATPWYVSFIGFFESDNPNFAAGYANVKK